MGNAGMGFGLKEYIIGTIDYAKDEEEEDAPESIGGKIMVLGPKVLPMMHVSNRMSHCHRMKTLITGDCMTHVRHQILLQRRFSYRIFFNNARFHDVSTLLSYLLQHTCITGWFGWVIVPPPHSQAISSKSS
mmetsp:Transcript_11065/g.20200  ORF Transcript_11065/g.20200 Transcript_11065/m.20200 type:complete len:132 (-) Transcript_11065:266-661(-)